MAKESGDGNNVPLWLNNEFLEEALRSGENDDKIEVISSEIKPATAPGDNFGSDMYRVIVQIDRAGHKEKKTVIAKCTKPANNEVMSKLLIEEPVFDSEIFTFTNVFPPMFDMLKEALTTKFQPIAANYIYSKKSETAKVIVLEDLKLQSFKLAERNTGLDLNHCLLVLKNIARFHAASLVMKHNNPECFQPLMTNFFSTTERAKVIEPVFTGILKSLLKEVELWPGYSGRFEDKLQKLIDNVTEEWVSGVRRNDSGFNVLTHGDLWANNMMFRYSKDDEEVQEVRFVDFQLTHWTSPAVDLQYFLNSSATPDVLEDFELVIEKYYSNLMETLQLLGYKHLQPTWEQIQNEIEKKSVFGVLSGITVRSVVLGDRTKVPDMNKVINNEESVHLSEAYKDTMKKLLIFYEKRGWL